MIDQISPSALPDWFASNGGDAATPLVLDVREPVEWQTASVRPDPAFDVLQLPMREIPARLGELDPARPVACLCHHGARSQRVAMFLVQHGFERVANIAGGIDAWALERDRTVPRY